MRFTATRTFFRWSRVLPAPTKFLHICTVYFWTLTITAFLSMVLFNCDQVICISSSGSSKNTSVAEPTEGISQQDPNNSVGSTVPCSFNTSPRPHTQDFLESISFCGTVLCKLLPELRTHNQTNHTSFSNQLTGVVKKSEKEYEKFYAIMARFDCRSKYSVKWNCSHCLKAYKDWICETNVQDVLNSSRVNSVRDRCWEVVRRCPYLLPATEHQYSGQPVFDCCTADETT